MNNSTKEALSLAAVGDIYINVGRRYVSPRIPILERADPASSLALVIPFFQQQDFLVGNQECPLSDRGSPALGKTIWFRSDPSAAQALVTAGFDAVGLANNHSLDFGVDALLQTVEVLEKAKIGHAGSGKNIVEAHAPAMIEKKGTRVALLSYSSVFAPGWAAGKDSPGISVVKVNTFYRPPDRFFEMPGMAPLVVTWPEKADVDGLKQDIKKARSRADIVVISWHWGISGGDNQITPYQVELAHLGIDHGADFIFGHHSHAPQGIEIYKGKAIFYGMGNFALDADSSTFAKESLIGRCYIRDKRIQEVSFLPVRINKNLQPEIVATDQGKDIVLLVQKSSEVFGTKFIVRKNEVSLQLE